MNVLKHVSLCTLAATLALAAAAAYAAEAPNNTPPAGFTALFNGKDLTGWKGLFGNPKTRAVMTPEQTAAELAKANEALAQHWKVEGGEIVSDGKAPHCCTVKDYRDFEMWVDWKICPKGDSGIYLRGSPQVQIWDPVNGIPQAKVGSGGLYNNKKAPSSPPVVADKPAGEWNTFYIRMVGERVTVKLNGQLTADNVPMENYWERDRPIYPAGQIELQTHGGETRFRNIYIREIPAEEAGTILAGQGADGFRPLFNGKDLDGWQGSTAGYLVENGILACDPKSGGVLLTKDEFADFALRLEFKVPAGGNNGVALRAPATTKGSVDALEIQLLDDDSPKYAKLKVYQFTGSLYGIAAAARGYARAVGEWQFMEITAKGPLLTIALNGTTILDTDMSKITDAPDGRKHPGLGFAKGHVGFLGHGAKVEFRNIKIKELK